ncbi:hypothetical protein KY284_012713 [Solanum tuberosum]|nr:hypothetical protein KY284_012713 [Solanum tuberosum]
MGGDAFAPDPSSDHLGYEGKVVQSSLSNQFSLDEADSLISKDLVPAMKNNLLDILDEFQDN